MPNRIECYDITTSGGEDNLGSMVVFVDGRPLKKAYRRFRIETVAGVDDYASMSEMIYRRLVSAREEQERMERGELARSQAKFLPLPDCIFLDGGKGHVSVIGELLTLLDMDIPLFGMVKDGRHRTRALIDGNGAEIAFKQTSSAFRLITAMQDEVHRFAMDYLTRTRKKKVTGSELLAIPGVGRATAKTLLRHFKSIGAIRAASEEELAAVNGISRKQSQNIYKFFHEKT